MIGIVHHPLEWDGWAKARALLEQSVSKSGDCTIEEVEAALADIAKAQLWVAGDVELVAVTQLYPGECFVWHMAGDFACWGQEMTDAAIKWARAEGCTKMELNARPGWQRRLRDWDVVTVTLRKVL